MDNFELMEHKKTKTCQQVSKSDFTASFIRSLIKVSIAHAQFSKIALKCKYII